MKFVVASLTDIPEALRGEYEEKNGKFYLKTEGEYAPLVESNTKLAEFRDNNRALNNQVTEFKEKLKVFDGIDPKEHADLKTKITELETAGVKGKGDVAAQITAAVANALKPVQDKLAAREASEAAAQIALARTNLENKLREVGTKVGIEERAMPDYINRGTQVFKLVDGKIVARNGDAPIFSKERPAEELGMEEWATTILQPDAPFLFKTSKGGGAGGEGNTGRFTGQRKVISSDPLEFGRNLEGIAKGEVIVQQ